MDNNLSSYSKEMVLACEAAIDAGVFYQDAFADFVVKHMGGYDCKPVLVETVSFKWYGGENFLAAQRAWRTEAEMRMKSSPRGHYILVEKLYDDGKRRYSTMVSAGNGQLSVGGSHDSYDEQPTGEKVLSRMIGYEVYCCRKAVEDSRCRDHNRKALEHHRYCVGQVFRNYRHPGETKPFSKATVTKIYPESGQVTMHLSKRGTSKMWEITVGAGCIEERIETPSKSLASNNASRDENPDMLTFELAG